jgi:Family of unknown function (DUF5317)
VFIFFILLASLLVALARGGSVDALASLRVRYLWLLFVPLLLQLVIFTPLGSDLGFGVTPTKFAYLASMLIAALALMLNRHLPGLTWIAAGLILNVLVITLNGGLMPVSAAARAIAGQSPLTGNSNNVIPMTSATNLWWFGDIFPLPAWLPFANVFSLGDILITLGGIVFIQMAAVPKSSPIN